MLAECGKQDMEEVGSWIGVVNPHLHPIVRKCGELTATEHTMMQQEVAFINTGVRASRQTIGEMMKAGSGRWGQRGPE